MVAELADAQDLGSCPIWGEGSNPSHRNPDQVVNSRDDLTGILIDAVPHSTIISTTTDL